MDYWEAQELALYAMGYDEETTLAEIRKRVKDSLK